MSYTLELYLRNFDAVAYAKEFLSSKEYEYQWMTEDFYHQLFTTGKLEGTTLLDVGSGATFRGAISASAYVDEIYLSDLLERNREHLKKWLKNQPEAIDYSQQFKHVAQLEGIIDTDALKARVRAAVKGLLHCNILADDPLANRPHHQFDIVTSSFCIDSFPEETAYVKGMMNIASLIRPGGRLALVAILGCTRYYIEDVRFPVAFTDVDKVSAAALKAELKILELNEYLFKEKSAANCDWTGFCTLLAEKRE